MKKTESNVLEMDLSRSTNCTADLVNPFIDRKSMIFYRQIKRVEWLALGVTMLVMFNSVVKCTEYEPAMVELDCRYDMMTGGRTCDCENRDKVMSEIKTSLARAILERCLFAHSSRVLLALWIISIFLYLPRNLKSFV